MQYQLIVKCHHHWLLMYWIVFFYVALIVSIRLLIFRLSKSNVTWTSSREKNLFVKIEGHIWANKNVLAYKALRSKVLFTFHRRSNDGHLEADLCSSRLIHSVSNKKWFSSVGKGLVFVKKIWIHFYVNTKIRIKNSNFTLPSYSKKQKQINETGLCSKFIWVFKIWTSKYHIRCAGLTTLKLEMY